MTRSALIDTARDLSPVVVAALGALTVILVSCALVAQLSARSLRRKRDTIREDLIDKKTGLLPRSALRIRLGAELSWAMNSGTPLAIAVLRICGSRFNHAARCLRRAMREEEAAFLLSGQRVVVEFWGANPSDAELAAVRLLEKLEQSGHPVVEAGLSFAPSDGSDVITLVTKAHSRLRTRSFFILRGVLPWFAGLSVLWLLLWRLAPAVVGPVFAGNEIFSDQLIGAFLLALGVPLITTLFYMSGWNAVPSSALSVRLPLPPSWRIGSGLFLLLAALFSWGVFAPGFPSAFADAFGVSLGMLTILLLIFAHVRQLVYVNFFLLIMFLTLGGASVYLGHELWNLPLVVVAGNLLVATAAGAFLAHLLARASWVLMFSLLAGITSLWSTYGGLDLFVDSKIFEVLTIQGPVIQEHPAFELGLAELVGFAFFFCWTHAWRIDARVSGVLALLALWSSTWLAEIFATEVSSLPLLCAMMIGLVIVRSVRLRARARAFLNENRVAT